MQTLYIDVYFLINFVIDLIALSFASSFLKLPSVPWRLMLAAAVGALYAAVYVFLPSSMLLFYLSSAAVLVLITWICTHGARILRRVKFAALFFVLEALIGGLVYYLYQKLDGVSGELFSGFSDEIESRPLLVFSVIVLLSIGVLRLLGGLLHGAPSERLVHVTLTYLEKTVAFDAFVDTGNLLTDPMDARPVMLIKCSVAKKLFPKELIEGNYELCDRSLQTKIRLIPVGTVGASRLMTGVRFEDVKVTVEKKTEHISVTIAIDKEDGTYGGYDALMPSAALENVF